MGRLDIPFGEEYLSRDASDNRLISHSLSDFWGIDEGVEVYGTLKHIQYVLAVQNGGHPSINDYNSDKSVTLRLGGDPVKWLHLGVSLMRTVRNSTSKPGLEPEQASAKLPEIKEFEVSPDFGDLPRIF